jgi:hypothetical protein
MARFKKTYEPSEEDIIALFDKNKVLNIIHVSRAAEIAHLIDVIKKAKNPHILNVAKHSLKEFGENPESIIRITDGKMIAKNNGSPILTINRNILAKVNIDDIDQTNQEMLLTYDLLKLHDINDKPDSILSNLAKQLKR